MPTHRPPASGNLVAMLLLTMGALGTSGCAGDAAASDNYVPPSEVARPSGSADAPEFGLVIDFDYRDGRLFLLEPDVVRILTADGEAWAQVAEVGRAGNGPGEFMQPGGIAATPTGFVVTERARLQFFDANGAYLSGRLLDPPCPMMRPSVSAARDGLFLHGGCMRRGYSADTMKAVLAWSEDSTSWTVVAEEPHYTSDGTVGSGFSSSTLFSTGAAHHLFGTGYYDCLWQVSETGGLPAADSACGQVSRFYRAPPPPEVAARLGQRAASIGLEWPERLPAYVDRLATGRGDILLRPFTTDSLILQVAGAAGREVAVMPMDGLVGCKREGCLWVFAERNQLQWLDRAAVERLIGGPQ